MTHPEIDLVFTYVDGADPRHAAKLARTRQALAKPADASTFPDVRPVWYRPVSEITYGVRSALRFLPWLRTIHIVTDQQIPPVDPELLASGRVRVVDHADIIPERYLPVFDATIIESFLHRIEGLSEVFLYSNDDMLFWRSAERADFVRYREDGTAQLRLMTQPGILRAAIALASSLTPPFLPRANTFTAGIANACRLLREGMGLGWLQMFYPRHFTHVYRVATARRIEEELGERLEETRMMHLRSYRQISWIALAYSLEALWFDAEHRASPAEERLFLDFDRYGSDRAKARAWRKLAQSDARFICLNNIPDDQAEPLAQIMAARGLGNPAAASGLD